MWRVMDGLEKEELSEFLNEEPTRAEWESRITKFIYAKSIEFFTERMSSEYSVTQKEREDFFKQNGGYPNVHTLCNFFVPITLKVSDRHGRESTIPFGIFGDEKFIIDKTNEDEVSQCLSVWGLNEDLRFQFCEFSKAIMRLKLSDEDRRHLYFVVLSDMLSARIDVYKKHGVGIVFPDIDATQPNEDVDLLRLIIDFSKLDKTEIVDIYRQDYFFNNFLTYKAWAQLISLFSIVVSKVHTEMVNAVSAQLVSSPIDTYPHLLKIILKISNERLALIETRRIKAINFQEYELKIFEQTRNASKEIIDHFKLIHDMSKKDIPKIEVKGSVGLIAIESNVTNSPIVINDSNNIQDNLNEIRSILGNLRNESISNRQWQETLVTCLSEITSLEKALDQNELGLIKERSKSVFAKIIAIKEAIEVALLPIEVQSKLFALFKLSETLPN